MNTFKVQLPEPPTNADGTLEPGWLIELREVMLEGADADQAGDTFIGPLLEYGTVAQLPQGVLLLGFCHQHDHHGSLTAYQLTLWRVVVGGHPLAPELAVEARPAVQQRWQLAPEPGWAAAVAADIAARLARAQRDHPDEEDLLDEREDLLRRLHEVDSALSDISGTDSRELVPRAEVDELQVRITHLHDTLAGIRDLVYQFGHYDRAAVDDLRAEVQRRANQALRATEFPPGGERHG